jgi:hypothetical protein
MNTAKVIFAHVFRCNIVRDVLKKMTPFVMLTSISHSLCLVPCTHTHTYIYTHTQTHTHTHTHTINVNKTGALQQTTDKTGTRHRLCEIDVNITNGVSFLIFRIVYPKLSAFLDCHFWIALCYSLTFSYRRLTFFPNCICNRRNISKDNCNP